MRSPRLPDAPNVIFMAGRKFGSTGDESLTWAMNTLPPGARVPAVPDEPHRRVLDRERLRSDAGGRGGSREDDPPAPVGEYAMSCLGRERMFEYFSRTRRHAGRDPPAQLRHRDALRRAVDLAGRVCRREPIDLTMGYFNVIWQGDANAMALAALAHTASPPWSLNLAGPEELSVRATCSELARLLGVDVSFAGSEAADALLSNGARGAGAVRRAARRCRSARRVDRRLGRARRREPGQADALRIAGRPVLDGGWHFGKPAPHGFCDEHGRGETHRIMHDSSRGTRRRRVIPAHPLALDDSGRLDERRQRALTRYYLAAGAGGLAVGVHTTQFAIRDPKVGLFEPVLSLAREEMDRADARRRRAADPHRRRLRADRSGACAKPTCWRGSAITRACSASPRCTDADDATLIAHCQAVGARIPLVGFYLQPSVGGRVLSYAFWRRFAEIPTVVAIKIAPFNRYQTLDVVRAVVDAGRDDIALYTGNDDTIVSDLVTPFAVRTRRAASRAPDRRRPARPLGGVDARRGRAARASATRRAGARQVPGGAAAARRRDHRRQRGVLRRRQRLRRLHRRAFTRSCGARACWRARGASIRTKRSAPARPPKSTASAAPTRIWQTMSSSRRTSRSGCHVEHVVRPSSCSLVAAFGVAAFDPEIRGARRSRPAATPGSDR